MNQTVPLSQTKSIHRYFPVSDRDKKWGIYVTTIGRTRIGPNEKYPPSGHPERYYYNSKKGRALQEHAIVYISRGGGWFESDLTPRRRIEAGQALYLFPGIWHRYMPDPQTGWDEQWVGFDGDLPRRLLGARFFVPEEPILQPTHEETFLGLFSSLIEFMQQNVVALQQVIGSGSLQILGLLYSGQHSQLTGGNDVQPIIQKALQRMTADFATGIDVPALARELDVSHNMFRHMFTEHTGLAPHQYIQELKLARARTLQPPPFQVGRDSAERVAQYAVRLRWRFCQQQTLGEAARSVNLSQRRFTKLFRDATGQSWGKHLQSLRLERAVEMLTETDKPICSVAFESGFEDLSHFHHIFKTVYDCSPLKFRRQHRFKS